MAYLMYIHISACVVLLGVAMIYLHVEQICLSLCCSSCVSLNIEQAQLGGLHSVYCTCHLQHGQNKSKLSRSPLQQWAVKFYCSGAQCRSLISMTMTIKLRSIFHIGSVGRIATAPLQISGISAMGKQYMSPSQDEAAFFLPSIHHER